MWLIDYLFAFSCYVVFVCLLVWVLVWLIVCLCACVCSCAKVTRLFGNVFGCSCA